MIRLADHVNMPALLRLLRALHDEAPNLRDRPFNDGRAVDGLSKMIDAGTAVIAQGNDGITGFLLFIVAPTGDWWSDPVPVAHEVALYVAPGHRGRFLASQLLERGKARARELGAARLHGGTTAGTATEAARVVWARAGGKEVGRSFVIDLEVADAHRTVAAVPEGA